MARDNFRNSLGYALSGLVYALRTQPNMRFHFGAALVVVALALLLGVGVRDFVFILFAIALVVIAEMFNTAVETVVNLYTDKYHPLARVAKDVAAGAVLLAALNSMVVGLLVFYPYLHAFVRYWARSLGGVN
ncbi:diacylglycerol kinase family protein [Desulfofundulus luciae]|nr:diacylglycerol kinase family protein [Desulfofundulus luciae]